MDPWDESDEPPAPRRPGWGCLAALIVAGLGTILVAVLMVRLLATMLDGLPRP